MIPNRFVLALILSAAAAACERPTGMAGNSSDAAATGNAEASAPAAPRPPLPEAAATLSFAAAGAGGCSARWNGEPVTADALLARSVALVDGAIAAVGGVQNITDEAVPALRVEAPAGIAFGCLDPMLAAVQRAALHRILLLPAGSREEPELASFPLTEIGAPASITVEIGRGGRMTWNRQPVTLSGLTERARAMSGGPDEPAVRAGELEIRPSREASFGAVYQAVRAIRQGNVEVSLLPPSLQPVPPPPTR